MISTRTLAVVGTLLLLGAGCESGELFVKEGAQKLTEQAVEGGIQGAIKHQTGQDVGVDFNQQGASFTDPKTGRSFAIGEKVAIPATFPKDVPVYPGATPTSATVNGNTSGLLLVIKEERKTVRDWYLAEAVSAGWTKDGTFENADNIILSFTRSESSGTAKMTVTIPPKSVDGKVNVIIARNGVAK